MEKLYSPKDIAERYGVDIRTARVYIKRMTHMEKPLMVTESALRRWEESRTVLPGETIRSIQNVETKRTRTIRYTGKEEPHEKMARMKHGKLVYV